MKYLIKKANIYKRMFSFTLCFLLLLNTYNYSAIVSDNDGSAFVTKSEFDALKNNFNKQIDDYNDSIDGKIDGAIANYLAGIQLATIFPLDNYIEKLNTSYNLKWSNSSNGFLTTKPLYKSIYTIRIFAEAVDATEWKDNKQYSGTNVQTIENTGFLKMPICNTDASGKVTVNYYEERQTEFTVDGYWCFPRVSQNRLNDSTAAFGFSTFGVAQLLTNRNVNPCEGKTTFETYTWNGYNGLNTSATWAGNGTCSMTLTGTCNVHTQNTDNKLILINTNSSAKTYYFNLDNTAEGGWPGSRSSGPWHWDTTEKGTKFDNANWQTMTGGNTYGAHFSGGSSVTGNMTPDPAYMLVPWSQNQMVSQNMYDLRLKNVTGKDKPIKNGVCMFDVEKKGTVNFKVKTEGAGSVKITAFKGSSESTFLYNNTQTYAANETKNYTIDTESWEPSATDKVQFWVLYTPSGSENRKLEVLDATVAVVD